MWIRKAERDLRKGVDSPLPTQVVSNEEFVPRPQNPRQRQLECLIGEMGSERARKLNLDRRKFMASPMGLATCFAAANHVYGRVFDVEDIETYEHEAIAAQYPADEYFVIDMQSRFTNDAALPGFGNEEHAAAGFENCGAQRRPIADFTRQVFFDSDTSMIVITGVLGHQRRDPCLTSEKKRQLNALAGSQRALCHANLAPNHCWHAPRRCIDRNALLEQMDRALGEHDIDSWRWCCHTDPSGSGRGFQLDDDNARFFYEASRKRGIKLFGVHKGYASQSRTLGHCANPRDVDKAARENPDLSFIIYHSALKHGPSEPSCKVRHKYDLTGGDFEWHAVLMDIKRRHPGINNVYPEIGSFFNTLVVTDPMLCAHGIGRNVKYYGADHVLWGTDCPWWGSPQWAIDAFRRFQIPDELCEKFGYRKLTKQDKAAIFGLNAARLYGIDVGARRQALRGDRLELLKATYLEAGGLRSNGAFGWVRADD